LWTYKDIGKMGLVYLPPESPYLQLLRPGLERKERFGVDSWTSTGSEIHEATAPLLDLLAREFPDRESLDFDPVWMVERVVRGIMLSRALVPEFAAAFRDLSESQIDALMQGFKLQNCVVREPLARVLSRETVTV
jgi:hypothetical protein